jgi:3-oxoacyl-[acyl-carrier-protein] synthase-3
MKIGTTAQVAAIEYELPAHAVTNADLAAAHPQWGMHRVVLSTGVERRHQSSEDETALDLAERACRRLLGRMELDGRAIDALLFCTHTPDHALPPNACLLQDRLGLPRSVAAFDFSLACSGFVYGLWLAKALIVSNSARSVLLVTADTYSRWVSPDDRGTATLFGDGAAATLLVKAEHGVGAIRLGTDGSSPERVHIPAGGARMAASPDTATVVRDTWGNAKSQNHLWMNGAALLDFVKREVPELVRELVAEARTALSSYDLVLLHQGSKVTIDYVYNALNVADHQRYTNIERVGNTVSASLPILLRDAERDGLLCRGTRLLLVGFGGGLSWGACELTW